MYVVKEGSQLSNVFRHCAVYRAYYSYILPRRIGAHKLEQHLYTISCLPLTGI